MKRFMTSVLLAVTAFVSASLAAAVSLTVENNGEEMRTVVEETASGRTSDLVVHSMVTRDGRRLVSRMEGTNEVFSLVAADELPAGTPPARPWRLYAVKATHTDIGLHSSQYVQRHGAVKRIDDAMRLIDADTRGDDDPAAYRYVAEGVWFWENYPMDRGEAAAWNVISNYVRRGRIDIGASCAGNHTHVFGPEELRRAALTRTRLREKWGVGTHTMLMTDNPGVSWSVVKPYAEAGIENLLLSPNQWNPIASTVRKPRPGFGIWNTDGGGGGSYIDVSYGSERPMVFRWESYDRSTNLLVWCSTHYYHGYARAGIGLDGGKVEEVERKMPGFLKILEAKYPYDVWLACAYADDEDANTAFADFAAKWNAKWRYPEIVTVGRLDEPFDELRRRFGDRIPTVRGEMTSGWIQHPVATPELLADKMGAERLLALAERAWRDDPRRDEADGREIDRAWWALVLNDEHSYGVSGYQGRRVFETWMQHRDWIERADAVARRIAAKYGVKSPEPQVADNGARIKENEFYRVEVNARGEILSIYDKELKRNVIDGVANRFLYTRDNHKSWADEALLGARIVRKVSLAKGAKRIDVEDTFEHATDLFNTRRYYRYGYLAFPFAVPGGRFRAMLGGGEVIDPYRDQCGYTTDAYVAVRDWCAVENDEFGVALRAWDSTLTEFGEIHPDKTCFTGVPPEGKTAIYPYLFNDWLQMHHPDGESINLRFRFSIVSYAKGKEPWRAGDGGVTPALTAANFPEPHGDGWTGLIEAPRAGHGEKDGQMYLLWGADLSPAFSHYELYRDGVFVAAVTNEAPDGIPYRVARYEDTGLGTHRRYTYRLRKVMKDGTKGDLSEPFSGLTRQVGDFEALESEGQRCEISRQGAYVTSWCPPGEGEVLFRPKRAKWGEEEVHGGIPICWPWFGRPPREGLPKHGLARYAKWTLEEKIGKTAMRWSLVSTPETMRLWPHEFRLDYKVTTLDNVLLLELKATNTGKTPFEAAGGFHPYFKVASPLKVELNGRPIAVESWRKTEKADGAPRRLRDLVSGRSIQLTATGNDDWFAWNPGVKNTPLCGTLGPDEWKEFFCVEPYSATPHVLNPGESETLTLKIEL